MLCAVLQATSTRSIATRGRLNLGGFANITVLPAALSLLPYTVKQKSGTEWSVRAMDALFCVIALAFSGCGGGPDDSDAVVLVLVGVRVCASHQLLSMSV